MISAYKNNTYFSYVKCSLPFLLKAYICSEGINLGFRQVVSMIDIIQRRAGIILLALGEIVNCQRCGGLVDPVQEIVLVKDSRIRQVAIAVELLVAIA